MLITDTLSAARQSLTRNKNRSLLTMLGVIIGVGSVVLMTSVGSSMEQLILGQISSIGAESMVVFPGQVEGPQGALQAGFDSLTFEDVEALRQLNTVFSVAPGMFISNDAATYGRETTQPRVVGTEPDYFKNREVTLALGRLIDDADVRAARNVTVLASEIADDLFGRANPIGKQVKMGNRSYEVIGTLESVGTQFFQNADEFAFIPITTARAQTGQKYVNVITMRAVGDFDLAVSDVETLLRRRHGIVGGADNDDFIVRTSAQANDILGSVSLGLTLFITAIAAISLVVGGIGIMNIMLVAVSERTREIGLRKAVGAKKRDVLLQFLVEAIALTMLAGCMGVIFGIGFAALIAAIVDKFLPTYDFALSFPAVGLALVMAFVTGLGFGMYPAKKAADLSPMNALRYE